MRSGVRTPYAPPLDVSDGQFRAKILISKNSRNPMYARIFLVRFSHEIATPETPRALAFVAPNLHPFLLAYVALVRYARKTGESSALQKPDLRERYARETRLFCCTIKARLHTTRYAKKIVPFLKHYRKQIYARKTGKSLAP